MGQQKNVDMSMAEGDVKVVKTPLTNQTDSTSSTDTSQKSLSAEKKAKPVVKKIRSKKYQMARSQVDKTRTYDPFSAIELTKRLSYSSFPGTITVHLELKPKHQGDRFELVFPHATGKSITVEIATAKTLKKITAGKIDFDVLLATADMMPQLAKHAAILGPKGLMPNPKQGTLLDKPAQRKKELEAGKITLRTEKKAPLIHVVIGNTKMETKQLLENLQALFDTIGDKLAKATLSASMSPGIKVAIKNRLVAK
jgi:large subunit ribosomal protein L1